MVLNDIQNNILAALFAAGDPVEVPKLAEALDLKLADVRAQLNDLARQLDEDNLSICLHQLGDTYQLSTKIGYGDFIRKVLLLRKNAPLSSASLEVLAVVAYNEPVTKSFVEQVRGVDSSSVVNSLVEKGLLEEAGRMDLPGRPISYRTTPNFLRCFGLKSLKELPDILLDDAPAESFEKGDQIDFAEAIKLSEESK